MSKIVIADDDPFLVKIYSTKLTQEGHEVFACEDGETALQAILDNEPDLVVLDIMIPRLNGLDVLASIKEEKKFKNTPVVFLSNLAQEEEQQSALSQGATEFLIKARYTPSQVIEILNKYISAPAKSKAG